MWAPFGIWWQRCSKTTFFSSSFSTFSSSPSCASLPQFTSLQHSTQSIWALKNKITKSDSDKTFYWMAFWSYASSNWWWISTLACMIFHWRWWCWCWTWIWWWGKSRRLCAFCSSVWLGLGCWPRRWCGSPGRSASQEMPTSSGSKHLSTMRS